MAATRETAMLCLIGWGLSHGIIKLFVTWEMQTQRRLFDKCPLKSKMFGSNLVLQGLCRKPDEEMQNHLAATVDLQNLHRIRERFFQKEVTM